MTVHLVVAMDRGRLIGRDNDLPWHLPADLRHFKRLTTGHPIIMGRRTWESVGKPLPNRTTIVVTSRPDLPLPEGVLVAASLDEALRLGGERDEDVFVVGGAALYEEALERADRLHFTEVDAFLSGDTYFPEFDAAGWHLVEEEHRPADARNEYALTFRTLVRK